jgi:hypothetical protein
MAPQVWICAGAHVEEKDQAPRWRGIREDAGDMFNPDARWTRTAKCCSTRRADEQRKVLRSQKGFVDLYHDDIILISI